MTNKFHRDIQHPTKKETNMMTPESLDEWLQEFGTPELIFADGFIEAIVGVATQFNRDFVVYDHEKCIYILMKRDGMTYDEAIDFFYFNVIGAYVGDSTPAFMKKIGTQANQRNTNEQDN